MVVVFLFKLNTFLLLRPHERRLGKKLQARQQAVSIPLIRLPNLETFRASIGKQYFVRRRHFVHSTRDSTHDPPRGSGRGDGLDEEAQMH